MLPLLKLPSVGVNYLTSPAGYYDGTDRVSATNAQIAALSADLLGLNIKEGSTIFGVAGSYPAPSSCSTQAYADSHASANPTDNCSKTWGTDTSVVGAEKKDPVTGLVWSNGLYKNGTVIEFSPSLNTFFSWDNSHANNQGITAPVAGDRTAIELCTDQGNGWRLPTQKELMQAYIDGSYWNLTVPGWNFWSATDYSGANAWRVGLDGGGTSISTKTFGLASRCVR